MSRFIGRHDELRQLQELFRKKSASFVVIRGRRRIGKSRLIAEFGKDHTCHIISGRPPKSSMTRQEQIDSFVEQFSRSFGAPQLHAKTWGEALWLLSQQCSRGKMIIGLDEISWIASKDKNFLGELKNAWDLHLSKNPHLILIVCGSVSSWIEENILGHTGFVGRISLDLQLKELPLRDAAKFWGRRQARISSHEILQILSVTGGVPRYLEEVRPEETSLQNLRRLCFNPSGLLFREYDQMFSDLFYKKAPLYTDLLRELAQAPKSATELAQALDALRGGWVTEHLRVLQAAGLIMEQPMWDLRSARPSSHKKYRLSDNYIRFYLRCILPNRDRIREGYLKKKSPLTLPGWEGIFALQFENLVLNNVLPLLPHLGIEAEEVLRSGPFIQTKTARRRGCQIDLLIQTQHQVLYLCEVKFSRQPVGMEVAHQIAEKHHRLALPKGYSVRPVLIHVNGVTSDLADSDAFDHIINFEDLLE